MARRHEAAEWLRKGYSPNGIARKMGVTIETVMGYLYNQVGEGKIRRSDIVFSIDERLRNEAENILSKHETATWYIIFRKIQKNYNNVDPKELKIYIELRDARVVFGDMYEYLRDIEVKLHELIKSTLKSEYGSEWWRKGLPEQIRIDCVTSLEKNFAPANEAYAYTNFIHIVRIIDKKWGIFSKVLPRKLTSNKYETIERLTRLNAIRNSVMHPVRGLELTDKDFSLVRELRRDLGL